VDIFSRIDNLNSIPGFENKSFQLEITGEIIHTRISDSGKRI
jgi:hypothetical protein